MKYLILECHPGYAVALDEQGRFLTVANLNYAEGETVSHVVEMRRPSRRRHGIGGWLLPLAAAACLCLTALGIWQVLFVPYGTVRMQINPDIVVEVNRLDYVVDVEPQNSDGLRLTKDYSTRGKKLDTVLCELADRAVVQGYLPRGGAILLTVQSDHQQWQAETERQALLELDVHLDGFAQVVTDPDALDPPSTPNPPAVEPGVEPWGDADDDGDDNDDDDRDDDDGDDDDGGDDGDDDDLD